MLRSRATFLITAALLGAATATFPADILDGISTREAAAAIKLALQDASLVAAAKLGAEDGFFSNDRVKIRLPQSLRHVEAMMRATGIERQADELVLAMNRAAEASMPEARALVQAAIKKMKVEDAKSVLIKSDKGATDYAAAATGKPLARKFLPVVKKAAAKAGIVEKYRAITRDGKQLRLVKSEQVEIEQYVAEKALDGFYLTMAEEEKALRKNPSAARSGTVQKVFGALR
jgi:hypothetical protein